MTTLTPVEKQRSALRIVACPRPFSVERLDFLETPGSTVAQLLGRCGLNPDRIHARVFLDDRLLPEAEWQTIMPSAGQILTIRVIPLGGGGGGKDALRIVAMIAVVALAIYSGGALAGLAGLTEVVEGVTVLTTAGLVLSAVVTAAVSIAGSLVINALIPPAAPKLSRLGAVGGVDSPSLSVTGARNQPSLYGPIPRVLGRHRIFPPYGAKPFTEIVGADQYLRLLFCLGYGPLTVSDLKIGTTPIDQYTDVQYEIRQGYGGDPPLTLYTNDVQEDALSILLTAAGGAQMRVSRDQADELSADIVFLAGLIQFDTAGNKLARTVQVKVEYRPVSGGVWTIVDSVAAVAAARTTTYGAHKDLTFTALAAGFNGNNINVIYLASDALRVTVSGRSITVEIVDGVTTATQIRDAINASTASTFMTAAYAPAQNGSGTPPAATYGVIDPGDEGQGIPPTSGWSPVWTLQNGSDAVPAFSVTEARANLVRRGIRWTMPGPGAFEVRLTRLTADTSDTTIRDQVYWSTFRTIRHRQPLAKPGLAQVALRIKATDQLNGVVDQFNCVVQSIIPDWTGTTWATRPTSNPAAMYREVLQGDANARALADSRLDLSTLQTWSLENTAKGFEFNQVIDFRTTVFQLLQDVAAAGRARFGMRDGKYAAVRDLSQTTPIQHFTPRNSWGFRGTKVFVDQPHALKVRFINPDSEWQQDEVVVYDDGYTSSNATKFETLELTGVTNSSQAWKLGRYHMAVARLRPETYELWTDIENLVCTAGDLVKLVHDIPQFGLGAARIKVVTVDGGGNATGLTLDDVIPMEAGKSYAVRIRKSDGTSLLQQITTQAGEQSVVTFTAVIPAASIPAVGDLVLFGILNSESVDCLVKAIDPGPDFTAKLTLVDAAPAVLTADSGTIPAFDSQITVAPFIQQQPAAPIVDQVRSDEEVLVRNLDGVLQSRILITAHFASGGTVPVEHVEVQWRRTGSTGAWLRQTQALAGDAIELSLQPVEDGIAYDVQLRSVGAAGEISAWTLITNHTVVGKTSLPPDVPVLVFDGDLLRWAYPTPPPDFAGFRIKARAGTEILWNEGVVLHDTLVTDMVFPIIPDGLVKVFMIKAVDVAGNESANPATLLDAGSATIVLGNLAETQDLKAQGFPGTIVNGTIVGGDLKADSETTFWTNDAARMWTLDSALFWTGSYKTMTYTFTVLPPPAWLMGKLRLAMTITSGKWTLTYRPDAQTRFWTTNSNLFWTTDAALMWLAAKPGFMTWPGAIGPMTRQVYEFQVVANGGPVQGIISAFKVLFDMPDITETFDNVSVPAAGKRLAITKTYAKIKSVQVTLDDDGGAGRFPMVLDKDYLAGPLVEVNDVNNVPVAGVVDAQVVGY